ncbi:hypothetical protein G3M48_007152 [Beauveria asiatica]|uniref:Uncharacterized protein n=1 Tax=Beauveria asiatica TaxID=1069075 RepID=A0AAW0RNH6_9HYPO
MYIPRGLSSADEPPRAADAVGGGIVVAGLDKRQFSDNPLQNTNTSIGVIVGVVLAVFLAGVFAFLWVYRDTVRCSGGRKRRRSTSSKSTKSSKSSKAASDHEGEAEPAPEAAAAADAPAA